MRDHVYLPKYEKNIMGNKVVLPAAEATALGIPGSALAVLLSILAALAGILWIASRRKAPVEDPVRVDKFLKLTKDLSWQSSSREQSIDALQAAVTDLFKAEVEYYYRSRVRRRTVSQVARSFAFLFGTLGLLCPLLAMAFADWSGLTRLGYLLFAAAAASLACNELFGGTHGHIRAVTTQYRLEALLETFVVTWSEWRVRADDAKIGGGSPDFESGVALLQDFSAKGYAILQDETKEWGEGTIKALSAYRSDIDKQRGAGHGTSREPEAKPARPPAG